MNTKRLKFGLVVSLLFVMGCQTTPEKFKLVHQINGYPFYETSIDNLPSAEDVIGIFIMEILEPEPFDILAIGDPVLIKKTIKSEYEAKDTVGDPFMVHLIANHLNRAERSKQECMSDIYIALLTHRGGYMVVLSLDVNGQYIYGNDFISVRLWEDFKTLGIFGLSY